MPEGGANAGLGIEGGLGFGGGSRFGVGLGLGLGLGPKAPGAEPTAGQWSPRKAELRAHGTVPVRIRLWLPRAQTSIGPWSRRLLESFHAAAARPGKRHGELPGSMPSQLAPLLDPRTVVLSDVGFGAPWGLSLSSVRVRSTDVACAEATLVL